MTETATQNPLLPGEPPKAEFRTVPLDELPTDEEIGPPRPEPALVRSIRDYGVWQPVALYVKTREVLPPKLEIVGGRRRIQAARAAGLREIPAMVGLDPEGVAALDVGLNATAAKNELAYLDRLGEMRAKGASMEEVSRATGLPKGSLKRLYGVLDGLLPELLAAAHDGAMAVSTAEAASKLPRAAQRRLLEILGGRGKLTARDVAEQRRARVEAAQEAFDVGLLEELPAAEDLEARYEAEGAPAEAVVYLRDRLEEVAKADRRSAAAKWSERDAGAVKLLLERIEA